MKLLFQRDRRRRVANQLNLKLNHQKRPQIRLKQSYFCKVKFQFDIGRLGMRDLNCKSHLKLWFWMKLTQGVEHLRSRQEWKRFLEKDQLPLQFSSDHQRSTAHFEHIFTNKNSSSENVPCCALQQSRDRSLQQAFATLAMSWSAHYYTPSFQ